MRIALSLAFTAALLPIGRIPAAEAEAVTWGTPQDGLRIGLATGPASSSPTLRVVFENVGSTAQTLLIGRSIGTGPIYGVQFSGTSPAGEKMQIFVGGPGGVAGLMTPLSIYLAQGETSEIRFAMSKMVAVFKPGVDRPLDALLREGYSVHASLEVEYEEVGWSVRSDQSYRFRKMWAGKMLSGEYRQPR